MAFQLRAILVATVFTADVLKGIVGLVLPTVNIALLCNTLDIFAEMVLGLAPSLPTNLWLSFDNPSPLQFFKRLWLLYSSSSIFLHQVFMLSPSWTQSSQNKSYYFARVASETKQTH